MVGCQRTGPGVLLGHGRRQESSAAVKRKLVPGVGRETVRILLERHDLKPWREKNVVRGRTR